MPIPAWTQTVDTLYTTTWAYRRPAATEQSFEKTPFIFWLREKGRVEHVSGYRRIEIPLDYANNDNIRWLSKGGNLPMQDFEFLTMAYENWKHVAVNITRYREDDQANRGKAAAINWIEAKLRATERGIWEEFERVMFADGTGSNEPNGTQNLISTSPTSGTVHGIDRALYPWFQNQAATASGAASATLIGDIRTCCNDIIKYSGAEIDQIVLVTTQTVYELYEDVHFDLKQVVNSTLADAGFDTVSYRGRPIIWCPSCPSGIMYFINVGALRLVCDEDYWMEMTDWKEPVDQPFDRAAQIVCSCNMVVDRPVVLKVLSGIAA